MTVDGIKVRAVRTGDNVLYLIYALETGADSVQEAFDRDEFGAGYRTWMTKNRKEWEKGRKEKTGNASAEFLDFLVDEYNRGRE